MLIENSIHILCFGNSLTAGFPMGHPYAISLLENLEQALPSTVITTNVQGAPGDQVVSPPGGYWPRLDTLYKETKEPYDWAIILGGTNDLRVGHQVDNIWDNLLKVWGLALSHGSKVLALTIPESGDGPTGETPKRDILNDRIRSHQAENFFVFDLHEALPYWRLDENERKRLWNDPVHYSSEGYDEMGTRIAKRLFELVSDTPDEKEFREGL